MKLIDPWGDTDLATQNMYTYQNVSVLTVLETSDQIANIMLFSKTMAPRNELNKVMAHEKCFCN